jgi:hypothetical protein
MDHSRGWLALLQVWLVLARILMKLLVVPGLVLLVVLQLALALAVDLILVWVKRSRSIGRTRLLSARTALVNVSLQGPTLLMMVAVAVYSFV